jgi:hypothetical protein
MSDLTGTRGDTLVFDTVVGGLPSSGFAGYTAHFTAKRDASDRVPVLSKAGTGQCEITTTGDADTPGVITTTISPADTASLPGYEVCLLYDVEVTDGEGVVTTVDSGTLLLTPDVTVGTP